MARSRSTRSSSPSTMPWRAADMRAWVVRSPQSPILTKEGNWRRLLTDRVGTSPGTSLVRMGTGTAAFLLLVLWVGGCSESTTQVAAPTATPTGTQITLSGSCAVPGDGSQGLASCVMGTPITVFRCDERSQCLHGEGLS